MRHAIIVTVLFLTACGGTWSNKDLEFVNALPTRAELKSKLPSPATTTQPLEGVQTRHDGLNVGDASKAYSDAKAASGTFNGLLDYFLGIVDTVRTMPPTTRTNTTRTWGPWPDKNNPGFEFQLVITRQPEDQFDWAIQARPKGGNFFNVVTGTYKATATIRHGVGDFVIHVKDFREPLKVTDDFAQFDQIDVHYANEAFPTTVAMAFTIKPGIPDNVLSDIGLDYSEYSDRSGKLTFKIRTISTEAAAIVFTTDWLPNGAGRATGLVTAGTAAGSNAQECWDSAFKILYWNESWNPAGPSGSPADCVAVVHPE